MSVVRLARSIGPLPLLLVGVFAVMLGLNGLARAQAYPPNGPDFPVITLNEDQSGAADLPPLKEPPPQGFDQESIWNMKKAGFVDDLGCSQGDQVWIENQNGREILYIGSGSGTAKNPITGNTEQCGVAIYDVTDVAHPKFLANIPGDPAGNNAPHTFVCGGDTLPHGAAGHFYLLTHRGSTHLAQGRHEIWDVTNPSAPTLLTTVVSGLNSYHKSWWECDTGIAYLIAGSPSDGWHQSGSKQHIKIYDLSNPASPKYIRDFGLVGQQPSANVASAVSCINNPQSNCYEGVTNPPSGIHEAYSAGWKVNRVYLPYGVGTHGVVQIIDRNKLLNGCSASSNSASCPASPSQADLLYPQVSYITENPLEGAHDANPIFGVPIPEEQQNYLNDTPQKWNLVITTSESTANFCHGEAPHNATLLDITDDQTPWPIATLNVPQFPGDFCAKGARFGAHHANWQIYAPYYGRLQFVTYFNAGLRVWDIRDPLNPRPVAYFIQAPDENTIPECGIYKGETVCRTTAYMDVVEVDDRGYIYGLDRAGTGLTILTLTGDAAKVVTGRGNEGH
jgi:hypothetical protein